MATDNVLEIKNLHTYFYTDGGVIKAVDGVDVELRRGATLGIVGESGSGKSVTSLSVMGLLAGTKGKIADGEILLDGDDIVKLTKEQQRKLRGSKISMIFQEPMTSLNPVMKIGDQVAECVLQHEKISIKVATEKGIELEESKKTRGYIINSFFEEFVEETLVQPTFIYDYPIEVSPLTKKKPSDKRLTERFEVFIGGREYGNAYSELNDPIDQYERFLAQVKQREAGDEEANEMDNHI